MRYRIAKDENNLDVDAQFCRGLTWSDDTIDEAYKNVKKLVPDAVIVKINEEEKREKYKFLNYSEEEYQRFYDSLGEEQKLIEEENVRKYVFSSVPKSKEYITRYRDDTEYLEEVEVEDAGYIDFYLRRFEKFFGSW